MKQSFQKKVILSVILLCVSLISWAQQTAQKYVVETNYLLYLPDGYNPVDSVTKWPLMMFLHGAGETGVDIDKVKVHGPPKLIENGEKLPFIVVSPQASSYGWKPEALYNLLQDVIKTHRVDTDRIYLTGLSMGGFGTWETAMEYPDFFAAIVPICGGGNTERIQNLKNMPVWCFHGAKDNVVRLASSEKMVDALKPYNPGVKFTIYPEANHDSWTETYDNKEVYDWMLPHTRFKYKQVTLNDKLMNEYAGTYCTSTNDTIKLTVKGNELQWWWGDNAAFTLKAASDNVFFIEPGMFESLEFGRDSKNKISHFTVNTKKEKSVFKKL